MPLRKIIFIVGPTAVGKTQVACTLARKLNGEIVSCDSMQVYKEIKIASNKPSKDILKKIPHHLISIVSIRQEFNVAQYRKKALKAIQDIHRKNKIAFVVGGSGLYMSILLDGIFKGGSRNLTLRKKFELEAKEKGAYALYFRLQEQDPDCAAKIHPNNIRRIIRALEVLSTTKKPMSQLQKDRQGLWGQYAIRIFALDRPRQKLYDIINQRVDRMFEEGLIPEIKALSKKRLSQTARAIIGVKEILGFLKKEHSLERAVDLMKLNTRHLAKRQLTWFRRDKRLEWLAIEDQDSLKIVAEQIFKRIGC